jgi:hypothetical protein
MSTWNRNMGEAPRDRPIDLVIDGRRFTDCTFYPSWSLWGRKELRGLGAEAYAVDRVFVGMPAPSAWAEIELPE